MRPSIGEQIDVCQLRSRLRCCRVGADIETGITIERALPETDAESAELHDLIPRWHEIGVDHMVMDFGNPEAIEPIVRFAEQVIAPLR